ncbi:WhiB family transcriptional regulator [Streptomyces sp. HPF1205]|uniref:WhiB family transcriptional regulator n=1 Tax=Streptomyces sp. HPF1205 TaxID=2873262 RepID=UPI001CEDA746|nr:WhiB family transcriptional regulator [Streptomyces sp. HPF1205]
MPRPSRYAPDTLPRPRTWKDDAACRGVDTSVFFPAGRNSASVESEAQYAKTFCAACPVRATCLSHALAHREDYGVWGGLDENERADLIRQTRLAAERQRRRARERERAPGAVA